MPNSPLGQLCTIGTRILQLFSLLRAQETELTQQEAVLDSGLRSGTAATAEAIRRGTAEIGKTAA